jgi:hypothetical protein
MRRLPVGIIGIGALAGLLWAVRRMSSPSDVIQEGVPPETEIGRPLGYPIKGNIKPPDDFVFHVPGEARYDQTHPEICFATVDVARKAGFVPAGPTA